MSVMTPQEPNDDRILKWTNFFDEKSLSNLSLEKQFQLKKILMDANKIFSQAKDTTTSSTQRQVIGDLREFNIQLVSSMFALYEGKLELLSKLIQKDFQ